MSSLRLRWRAGRRGSRRSPAGDHLLDGAERVALAGKESQQVAAGDVVPVVDPVITGFCRFSFCVAEFSQ